MIETKNSVFLAHSLTHSSRSEIYVWDLSRPPAPVVRRTLHEEGVRAVRFAGASEAVVATNGQPNYGVKASKREREQLFQKLLFKVGITITYIIVVVKLYFFFQERISQKFLLHPSVSK